MLEIAIRRRSLSQRLSALLLISLLLLPIPVCQVLLHQRSVLQATAGAMLGEALGIQFFFALRFLGLWSLMERRTTKQERSQKRFAYWLEPWDNLTQTWGGCVWGQTPVVVVKETNFAALILSKSTKAQSTPVAA
mmetsp:Transcript_94445/g.197295  ORF Transcript_94445/g.197295 Transcript_94445/m.197295 type:complete len:135 (+) Transcript_94445:658-1062(+)